MKQTILFTLFAAFSFSVANAQVPSYVPTDGLVGWWPFNGDAADESGNGNDGTVVGATLTTDRNGVENAAFDFNAFDWTWGAGGDYVYIPFSNDFNSPNITVSAWFLKSQNYISNQTGPAIIKRFEGGYSNPNGQTWGININAIENEITAFLLPPNSTNNYPPVPEFAGPLTLTESWQNITLTFNGSLLIIYLNGSIQEVIQTNNFVLNTNGSSGISIGMSIQANGHWEPFHGQLDDIGIWNRALTEEEIQLLFNGCTVTPTAIVGENAPLNFTTSTYFCNDNPGSSYTWTVTNGVISSGQGTNSIVVLWGNEGEGTVSVIETNAEGCDGPVASFVVDVQCSSNITSIDGNINPVILSPIAYTVNGPADSEYTWSVTNGVIVSGQGTNSVNVIWAAEGEGTLSVIETTSTGCESPVVTITTNATVTSVIEQEDKRISIYPNPASDRMTLQCGAENIGEEYIIYDALGKIVMRGKIINTVTTININELRSAEYFIKIGEEVIKAVKE